MSDQPKSESIEMSDQGKSDAVEMEVKSEGMEKLSSEKSELPTSEKLEMRQPRRTLKSQLSDGLANLTFNLKRIWANMTIEPAMFLMAFTWSLSGSTGSQLLIYKSCRIDFNQNDTTCHNLFAPENKALNDAITDKVPHMETHLSFVQGIQLTNFGYKRIRLEHLVTPSCFRASLHAFGVSSNPDLIERLAQVGY